MTTAATIVSQLILEDAGFDSGMSKAQKTTDKFHGNFKSKMSDLGKQMANIGGMLATAAIAAGTVAVVALGNELYKSVQAAAEAEAVQAQLNAVLESTGGIAGVTAEQVNSLADSLSKVTPFEDEAIIAGENMLLTFTNIGKDVFPLATETILDMSTALGTDLQNSAIMLGKALNDPVQGVSALRRVGVQLSDEQENMVKQFMAMGDVASAQAVILEELQKEFGGSAEAAGKTFAGQLTILQTKLGNIRESIGAKLMPVLLELATMFSDYLSRPEVQKFLEDTATAIADFAKKVIDNIPAAFQAIKDGWQWLMDNKGLIVAVLAILTAAMLAFAISTIIASYPIILAMAAIGLAAYLLYEAWTNNWGGIQEKTAAFWAWLQPILQNIWNWLSVNIPLAIQTLQTWWQNTLPVILDVWEAISDAWEDGAQFIYDLTHGNLGEISAIWDRTTAYIKISIITFITVVKTLFKAFGAALKGDWQSVGLYLGQAARLMWEQIKLAFLTGIANIKSALSAGISALQSMWNNIDWGALGRSMMDAIKNAIFGAIPNIVSAVSSLVTQITGVLSGFLNGINLGTPSTGGTPGGAGSGGNVGPGGQYGGFASGTGGWMTIPQGFPNDSYMMAVESGEHVNVVPKGQSIPGGAGTVNYFNPMITILTGKNDPRQALKGLT